MDMINATIYNMAGNSERYYAFVEDATGYYVLRKLPFFEYMTYYHCSTVDEIRLDAKMNHWLVLKRTDCKEEAKVYLETIVPSKEEKRIHNPTPCEGQFTAWFIRRGQYIINKALKKQAYALWD